VIIWDKYRLKLRMHDLFHLCIPKKEVGCVECSRCVQS
jgi:hypothetical protein